MSKRVVLCDLDGTLADVNHRLHYIKNDDGTLKPYAERDWDSFNKACVDDKPNEDVIEILRSLLCRGIVQERDVYILSGRNDVVRDETYEWLQEHVFGEWEDGYYCFTLPDLRMRKADDRRPDTEIKLEMVQELGLTPDDVLCILDDRQCVVDMWRENGFRCLQVDAWEEEPNDA